jgi:hypothetical protein
MELAITIIGIGLVMSGTFAYEMLKKKKTKIKR